MISMNLRSPTDRAILLLYWMVWKTFAALSGMLRSVKFSQLLNVLEHIITSNSLLSPFNQVWIVSVRALGGAG